jgi:indole-3-glycerol phosphate synthase
MSYLARIIDRKRRQVRESAANIQLASLQTEATVCTTDVVGALRHPGTLRFIAEHKRKSPSRGFIRKDSDPADIGRQYEVAGAAAMSVLTDEMDFAGSPGDLRHARDAVSIPILCKDFIVSPVQVFQARAWGADLVLLIVAALSRAELQALHQLATGLGMTPLVEVHDAHELDVAVSVGAQVIGVNNRDLHTFTVDLAVSEALAPRFPEPVVRVSESGIDSVEDLKRLQQAGYHAVLMGERLMRAPHPGRALSELREAL